MTHVCTSVCIVIVQQSFARTLDSALLVLGGASQIYIDSHDQSPVLKSFELFGCFASSFPSVFYIHDLKEKRPASGAAWKRVSKRVINGIQGGINVE